MTIPEELISDLEVFAERWEDPKLCDWLQVLPEHLAQSMSEKRYGDLKRWRESLRSLPDIKATNAKLDEAYVRVSGDIPSATRDDTLDELKHALHGLHPWRKGPFSLFGVDIETEWRSDFKWERLASSISSLTGRRVLDVGCGSGYHCWRMRGAGATEVIGIDPTPLFVLQFKAIQKYLQEPAVHVLPLTLEQLPPKLRAFDTVFSMGVLYHRRSPIDHLTDLRDALSPGGELVLETLVVEGDEHTVFVPPDRYAKMGNVWFLPSPSALERWLSKIGFKDIQLIDVSQTTLDEQRSTSWMTFHSLVNFLDPSDHTKTVEGHPAPRRAILTAQLP